MSSTERLDSIIETAVNEVFDFLLAGAPYLTGGKSSYMVKGTEKEKFYFPDDQLFSLIVLNIVIPVLVNIFSNRIYDRWFSNKNQLVSRSDLEQVRNELKKEINSVTSTDENKLKLPKDYQEIRKYETLRCRIEDLLFDKGWPREKAKADASEVLRKLNEIINKELK